MTNVSSLVVKIGADISELQSAMGKVQKSVQDTGKRMTDLGGVLSKSLTAPLTGLGLGILALQKKTGDYADQLLDLSVITGISTDSLQEFRNVARVAGVEQDALTRGVESLTRRMQSLLDGSGNASDAMKKLGISARDSNGQIKPTEEIMVDIMTALGDVSNEMERAALGNALLGRSYHRLAPVIAMGGDEIDKARQQAHDLGFVMSGESLNAANDFRVAMEGLKEGMASAGRAIAVDLMPFVQNSLIPMFNDAVSSIRDVIRVVSRLDASTLKLILTIGALVAAIGPALFILGKLVVAIGALLSPIGLVIIGISALAAAVLHVWDNWEAVTERISDTAWWQNTLIELSKLVIEYGTFPSLLIKGWNVVIKHISDGGWFRDMLISLAQMVIRNSPFSHLTTQFTAWLETLRGTEVEFNMPEIPNIFQQTADQLDNLKTETKEYEHQFGSFGDAIESAMKRAKRSISGLFGDAGDEVANATEESMGRVSFAYESASERAQSAIDRMVEAGRFAAVEVPKQMEKTTQSVIELGQALQTSITSAATTFAESIGQMISAGSQGGTFFQRLLVLIGDFASQFGRIAIAMGVAALQIQTNLLTNPLAVIAAGGALVALGSALSSLVSSGIGGSGGGGAVSQSFQPSARSVPETGGNVVFEIEYDKLVGVLDNGDRRRGRVG